jgi:hypothetical protein
VTANVWVPIFNAAKVPVIGGEIVDDEPIKNNPYHFSLAAPVTPALKATVDAAQQPGPSPLPRCSARRLRRA